MAVYSTSSISMQISATKIQIFRLWKVKGSCIWGYDKTISPFYKKAKFIKQVRCNFFRILQQVHKQLEIFRNDEKSLEAFLSWYVIKNDQTYFMNVLF